MVTVGLADVRNAVDRPTAEALAETLRRFESHIVKAVFSSITFEQLLALRPIYKVGLAISTLAYLALGLWILDSPQTSADWLGSLRSHFGVSVPSIFIIVASLLFALVDFARNCFNRHRFNRSFERRCSSMYGRSVTATKKH